MSSEIRAGNNRTYWIISNGNSYVDGVTDPDLVTTAGNGWHVAWIGSDSAVAKCLVSSPLAHGCTFPNTQNYQPEGRRISYQTYQSPSTAETRFAIDNRWRSNHGRRR